MSLMQNMGDILAHFILFYDSKRNDFQRIAGSVIAYTDAVERVLGASPGSIHFFDVEILRDWLV